MGEGDEGPKFSSAQSEERDFADRRPCIRHVDPTRGIHTAKWEPAFAGAALASRSSDRTRLYCERLQEHLRVSDYAARQSGLG